MGKAKLVMARPCFSEFWTLWNFLASSSLWVRHGLATLELSRLFFALGSPWPRGGELKTSQNWCSLKLSRCKLAMARAIFLLVVARHEILEISAFWSSSPLARCGELTFAFLCCFLACYVSWHLFSCTMG